ncbi:MAG: HEAT repeat domain-containing protein [Gammaproteobacteria bacterium]|nr:HEAT repeat domain-containing protein [Gammaproteobacteria bacterium]
MSGGWHVRVITAALALIAWPCGESMAATLDALAADGVYTWRVAATEDAPPLCCVRWSSGSAVACECDLDSRHDNYSAADGFPGASGEMQIYALIESGRTRRIRALSPQCAVTSRLDITDLGLVDVDESLAWLKDNVTPTSSVASDALAAVAVHEGAAALRFLMDIVTAAPTMELRKEAIFWMSQARISESAGELERLMFDDESSGIRQHAAFSLAQSTAENRADALIRQGREDNDPEVRSQAWFWLAQTGASESEEAIQWALANDDDDEVREEAVFAMSQLPEDRAVDALLAVLGNRQLQREVREQALFWLAQSDSERAFEHLDRLLSSGQ